MLATPKRTPSYQHTGPKQYQFQEVSAGWHHGSHLSSASPPGTSMCFCRGGQTWEGGEGRVQAERPTHTRPQRQGNGPEGERHTQLDHSPCPGRRCPCGCPQQVDRLGHPLARGVARMAPGWLPTIMAGPTQPCPQPDDTRPEHPRRRSGDMDPPAGDTSVVCGSCGRSCCAGLDRRYLR